MGPYEALLAAVLATGEDRPDRTGTGTLSLFAPQPLTFDLRGMHVPLITSKQVAWRMALKEYMWMLSGSTSTVDLGGSSTQMANIWNNWADERGDIGPTYGAQYRDAGGTLLTEAPDDGGWTYSKAGVDQLGEVIHRLAETPDTRRALISLWSVPELQDMALEPCMVLFQFSLRGPNLDQLHLHIYQRSADMMLGVPFDLFQGGLLAHLVARELSYYTDRFIDATNLTWSAGDVHVYNTHLPAAFEQLLQAQNAPKPAARLVLPPHQAPLRLLGGSLTAAHIDVIDYHSAPRITAGAIAV